MEYQLSGTRETEELKSIYISLKSKRALTSLYSNTEASKRVPIFSFATQGGKHVSSYFRQRSWVQAREAQIRFPAG